MSPNSPHRIGLVQYDSYLHAWVLDLPGCVTGGASLDEVSAKLPLVLAEHAGWLAAHGEPVEQPSDWEIAETLDAARFASAGGEFCFEANRAPMSAGDLEAAIARMAYARADLLAAIDGVPDTMLDWAPPASAFESFDAWAPEVRTIRDVVAHVLQLDAYYRGGLRDGPSAGSSSASPTRRPNARAPSTCCARSRMTSGRACTGRCVRRATRPRSEPCGRWCGTSSRTNAPTRPRAGSGDRGCCSARRWCAREAAPMRIGVRPIDTLPERPIDSPGPRDPRMRRGCKARRGRGAVDHC